MHKKQYEEHQKSQEVKHESVCNRCGICCGVRDDDLCLHLQQDSDGKYSCNLYHRRFGVRKTTKGRMEHQNEGRSN